MSLPLSPRVWLSLGCAAFLATDSPLPAQVAPAAKDVTTPAAPPSTSSAAASPDLVLLGALQSNPVTAPYRIGTAMRGGRVVLWGKVGTKYVHDVAVRIAIDLGYPFRDDLVIDTPKPIASPRSRRCPPSPSRDPWGAWPPMCILRPCSAGSTTRFTAWNLQSSVIPPGGRRSPDDSRSTWPRWPMPDSSVIPRPARKPSPIPSSARRSRPGPPEGEGRDDDRPAWACDPPRVRPDPGRPHRGRPEARADAGCFGGPESLDRRRHR